MWEQILLSQKTKKRSRSVEDEDLPIPRKARLKTTVSVPIHGLLLKGEVPVIRIRRQSGKRKNTKFLTMFFPKQIFDRNARLSLQHRFGHDDKWSHFVQKELTSVVDDWHSVDCAQEWLFRSAEEFVQDVNRKWSRVVRDQKK